MFLFSFFFAFWRSGSGAPGDSSRAELHQPHAGGAPAAPRLGLREAPEVLPQQQPRAPAPGLDLQVGV